MEMKQVYENDQYKVMSVSLNKGEAMPLHKVIYDAFIIVQQGKGKITFTSQEVELAQGSAQIIPGNEPHKLEIQEDFKACVILQKEAEIKFL